MHTYRDYGFTEKTYIDFLLNIPLTSHLVPLLGETVELDGKTEKMPVRNFRWRDANNWAEFAPYAEEHLRRGGWFGIAIKPDYTVIDIDETEPKQKVLDVYGKDTFAVSTKRGVHLYYSGGHAELTGRKPCLVFSAVDYQNYKRYVVAPFSDENRVWNGVTAIAEMPIEFYIPPSAEIRRLYDNDTALYHLKDGDGRNNVLYSIGRKVRLYAEQKYEGREEEVVEDALYRIANLFADPLPSAEVGALVRSVFANGHREDFEIKHQKTAGGERGRGDEFFRDDGGEYDVNPFTVLKPISEFREAQRQEVVKGLCREGDVVLLCGAPKGGKSTFLRSLAISATSENAPPLPVLRRGKVWWYILEEHPSDVFEVMNSSGFAFRSEDILVSYSDTNKLRDPLSAFVSGLRHLLATTDEPPLFIFVDTVGRIMGETDINDYTKVQRTIETIRWAIRDFPNPPVVVLVHHTNKNSEHASPLGSQAFSGSSDVVILLETTEEGVTMRATGRNVCPSFAMQSVPLIFRNGIYVGVGYSVNPELAKLVRMIHRGEIASFSEALKYQGGVFRSDIRRLLRNGVLVVRDGNIYTNTYNKQLEKYLTITDTEGVTDVEGQPTGGAFELTAHDNHLPLVIAGGGEGALPVGAVGKAQPTGNPEAGLPSISADVHPVRATEPKQRYGTTTAERRNGAYCSAEGQRNGYGAGDNEPDGSSPQRQRLPNGEILPDGENAGVYHGGREEPTTEPTTEPTDAHKQDRTRLRREKADMAKSVFPTEKTTEGDLQAMEEVLHKKPLTENDVIPADWQLEEQYCLPPILQKGALNFLTHGSKSALRPSDIDPFCEDRLLPVELGDAYNSIVEEYKRENPDSTTLPPLEFAKRVAKFVWDKRELTLQEAISVHVAILKKYGKPHSFFPTKIRGFSGWFLVCIHGKPDAETIELVPITDEEASNPDLWRSLFFFYLAGNRIPVREQYKPLERLLKSGYVFHRYRTPEGKVVYVLAKERFKIETEDDFYRYLAYVLGVVYRRSGAQGE